MKCSMCEAGDFKPHDLTILHRFYDHSHQWISVKTCLECGQLYLIYGVEICDVGPDRDDSDIHSYAVPISFEDFNELNKIDWEKDMLSWEKNTAKRLILTRRHHGSSFGRNYWSQSTFEPGLGILPPG